MDAISALEAVKNYLLALPIKEREEYAKACGVPYSTLQKVVYGHIKNPGVYTVQPMYEQLPRERKAAA
jgi:predicted transcriptional regulator